MDCTEKIPPSYCFHSYLAKRAAPITNPFASDQGVENIIQKDLTYRARRELWSWLTLQHGLEHAQMCTCLHACMHACTRTYTLSYTELRRELTQCSTLCETNHLVTSSINPRIRCPRRKQLLCQGGPHNPAATVTWQNSIHHTPSASCSAQPGLGKDTSCSIDAEESTFPASSTSIPFDSLVPMSIPRKL